MPIVFSVAAGRIVNIHSLIGVTVVRYCPEVNGGTERRSGNGVTTVSAGSPFGAGGAAGGGAAAGGGGASGGGAVGMVHTSGTVESQCAPGPRPERSSVSPWAKPSLPTDPPYTPVGGESWYAVSVVVQLMMKLMLSPWMPPSTFPQSAWSPPGRGPVRGPLVRAAGCG